MDWNINRQVKKPIYKQIAEYIENGIADGTFPPDQSLPSERALANELQVNRSTVVAAYDELEANGLIERKKGSGTTISKDIWGMTQKRIPSWNRYIEAGSFLPNIPILQRLRKEMVEHKLINLASGELSEDLFPVRFLREMMSERSFVGGLGYDHPQGNHYLRETIVNHVKQYRKIETNPSSILITSGAQQALYLVVQCLLKSGDAVAIEDPSYSYSLPIFQSAGVRTFHLPVDKDGINPEHIVELHKKHRIRMVFLNPAFQNPTGTLLHTNRRKRIIEISSEYGIPIIEDDPYSLMAFAGEDVSTLKSMDDHGNILYISSLSKIVASGLRIGWIIGPNPVIERLSDAKQQIDFGHGTFNQWVANDFLSSNHFHSHISYLRQQLEKRRNQIVFSLKQYLDEQIDFYVPAGGIHLWCKIRKELNEMKLLEESIKRGVIYSPGFTLGSKRGYVRFTFAREKMDMIEEGIKRFAAALKSL
jgi:GntR family transcriptional regulator, regulator for abcA and norABC